MKLILKLVKAAFRAVAVLSEIQGTLVLMLEHQRQLQPSLIPIPGDKWLDSNKVCIMLGVTPRSLYNYTKSGELKSCKRGGKHYYKESDVLNF